MEIKESRARLISDPQQVAETFGDQQQRPIAFPLKQGVRGDGCPHLDGVDRAGWNRIPLCEPQFVSDALNGGVAVLLWVFRQQFAGA